MSRLARERQFCRSLCKSRKYRKLTRVNLGGEFDPELSLLFDDMAAPGMFYALERHFWIELWRVPVVEAVEEQGIEARHYGPVRVFAFSHEPRTSLFNIVLGADRPGAVERGHLAEALDWTESLGLDCRVPVRNEGEFGEPGGAEDLLNRRGYRRTGTLATLARSAAPPGFSAPPGIEVEELVDESMIETFSHLLAPAYGLEWSGHGFIVGLPGKRDWRTYVATDSEGPLAAAAMFMHYETPQLGFAGTVEEGRGRGAHMALLHRRIEDARAAGAGQLFAVTEEPLDYPDSESTAAPNLVRAGFRVVGIRTVWQPPEDLLAGEEDAEDDELDDDELDDDELDDDHDFKLGG